MYDHVNVGIVAMVVSFSIFMFYYSENENKYHTHAAISSKYQQHQITYTIDWSAPSLKTTQTQHTQQLRNKPRLKSKSKTLQQQPNKHISPKNRDQFPILNFSQ